MSAEKPDRRPSGPGERLYGRILDEARGLSDKALGRLRELSSELPGGVIEQVERLHDDPVGERRKSVRVDDHSLAVAVVAADLPAEGTAVKNHCPAGLAILLPCPAGVGTVLRVRMPPELGGAGWVSVQVRYCRKEANGWVAGCELLGEQPPI